MPASRSNISAIDSRYAKLTVAAAVFFVVLEAVYFVLSGLPSYAEPSLDFTGNAVGRDFLTVWMNGRSLLGFGPAAWLDPAVYNAALRVMLGSGLNESFWFFPPHFILLTWPLGLLPYLPAYALWCALGIALYLLASAAVIRREYLLFLAVAPGVAVCVFFGQNGFFTAALLIGGFALLDRRPILAGILFGILTVKPQLCILLPIMLLLTGRWWTLGTAAVTAAALAGAAMQLLGPDVWSDFIEKVIPQQLQLLQNGGGLLPMMVSSVFFAARLVGVPLDLAWNLQGLISFLAAAAVVWAYRRPRDPVLSMALFITATFLATPLALNYDMVVFGCIVAALRQYGSNTATDHALGLAVWSLPVTMMLFGVASIPIAPLVLVVFASRLLWRLANSESGQRDPVPAPEPLSTETAASPV
jgi:hypothetical protein